MSVRSESREGAGLRGYSLGIAFIVVVAVIWAGASVLTQFIYTELDFHSPFLVTYISTGLFALYLPLWRVWVWLGWVRDPPLRRRGRRKRGSGEELDFSLRRPYQLQQDATVDVGARDENEEGGKDEEDEGEGGSLLEHTAGAIVGLVAPALQPQSSYEPLPPDDTQADHASSCVTSESATASVGGRGRGGGEGRVEPHNSHEEVLVIAMKVAPLWFLANCGYNYSLLLTSVGSSTIIRYEPLIDLWSPCVSVDVLKLVTKYMLFWHCSDFLCLCSNLSGSFTLLFAYLVGIERITGGKLLALFISLGGVALVWLPTSLLNNMYCI